MTIKPWIKFVICGLIGFGAGFGSGFLVHKKINDAKFEEISDDEMAMLEQEIEAARQEKAQAEANDIPDPESLPEDPDKLRNALQGKKPYKGAEKPSEVYQQAYNTIQRYSSEENAEELPIYDGEEDDSQNESPGEEEFDQEFMEMLEQETVEPGQMEPPHVISLGEFYNERPNYDKITIDWYEEDNTFLDEREEIIANIQEYAGMDVASLFANTGPNDDPDVRFIRNEHYNSDYEIIRHHRSWKETSGGED